MNITKREVLVSVIIVAIMMTIGFFIISAITDGIADENEDYYKAVKITDAGQFQYAFKTAIGNALAQGEITAITPVTIPEISGEYYYIKKMEQRYSMLTRTDITVDADGNTHTTFVTYYDWTAADSNEFASEQFEFMGVALENSLQGVPESRADLSKLAVNAENVRENYLYEDSSSFASLGDIRYYYYIIPKSFNVTVEAKIGREELSSFNGSSTIKVHYQDTISDVMSRLESKEKTATVIFWTLWVLLIGGAVGGFFYFENRWLEG